MSGVDLASIDRIAIDADDLEVTVENRDEAFRTMALALAAAERLQALADELSGKIAATIPVDETVTIGGRQCARTRKPSYKRWKNDDVIRTVLDSRRFDQATGELIDETPLEKVRSVWTLAGYNAKSDKALRERGVEPDEFAEVEWGPLRLKFMDKR